MEAMDARRDDDNDDDLWDSWNVISGTTYAHNPLRTDTAKYDGLAADLHLFRTRTHTHTPTLLMMPRVYLTARAAG